MSPPSASPRVRVRILMVAIAVIAVCCAVLRFLLRPIYCDFTGPPEEPSFEEFNEEPRLH
jgi:cytochrome c oxidase assembly factor CtaG